MKSLISVPKWEIGGLIIKPTWIPHFQEIAEQLCLHRQSSLCPKWDDSLIILTGLGNLCDVCYATFPSCNMNTNHTHNDCPCSIYPFKDTFPFIDQIIRQSEVLV